MSKSSPPAAPNPQATAGASTSTNVATALANAYLGNVNQVTPQGSLTYDQTGSFPFFDPYSGFTTSIPQFTATQTLNPQQQRTEDQTFGTQYNLAALGNTQSQRLGSILNANFDPSASAYPAGDPNALLTGNNVPNYQYTTDYTGPGPTQNIDTTPYTATLGYEDAYPQPVMSFNTPYGQQISVSPTQGQQQYNFSDVGGQQRTFDAAGNIINQYDTQDPLTERSNVENALFQRIQPQNDRDLNILEQRLADQGIKYGSPAYQAAMDQYQRGITDQRLAITAQGGQEQKLQEDLLAQQAGFANAAQQQAYQQAQGRGQFANTAQQQAFAQALQRGQFTNAAQAQDYAEQLQSGQFYNTAANAAFNQTQQQGQFENAAIQQYNADRAARAAFYNQGVQQDFGQRLNATQLGNAAQQQAFQQSGTRADLYNQAVSSNLQRTQQIIDDYNARRAAGISEAYAARNQPINEIAALMSGSQVSSPNFVNTTPTKIPTTDTAGLINNKFTQDLQTYNAQNQQYNQLLGGLFGGIAGLTVSDERVKENIHRIGSVFAADPQEVEEPANDNAHRLPIYEYSYKHDPASVRHVGPMAQDVEQYDPGAVHDIAGIKHIDTRRVMGGILKAA